MSVLAVVLAAGRGSRFEGPGPKLLAPLGKTNVIFSAVAHALASHIGDTIVVTGAVDLSDSLPVGAEPVHNANWFEGIATSLAVAVRVGRERGVDAIVVGLGDQPGVPSEAWALVAAAEATPVAVATYAGKRANPVRLGEAIWTRLPVAGDAGARLLIRDHPELVTEVPCPGDPGDIDTVRDLQRWSPSYEPD